MINYWWVTRPKRKLDSVPEVLSTIASAAMGVAWQGERATQLDVEKALEEAGLKRVGERRDRTAGGARTYVAWLSSLGLLFRTGKTRSIQLTLAGEDLLRGVSPVRVLTAQIFRYQFPSPFSLSRSVCVSPRFRIRPFRFLFRLLIDPRIASLSQQEIGFVIATEAETESNECYERVVRRILDYRDRGSAVLTPAFRERFATSKTSAGANPEANLLDIANTIMNWAEYTQLARRNESKKLAVLPDHLEDVKRILSMEPAFIERPDEEEVFQRKFGLGADHSKDTRNLVGTASVTASMVAESKIRTAFIAEACKTPISKISKELVHRIAEITGIVPEAVETALNRLFPHGALSGFMHAYHEMAFAGREEATDFEVATTNLFREVFGFGAKHVGPKGLTPDVLLASPDGTYQAIVDNKAYREYGLSNDHWNRMVTNYIGGFTKYASGKPPLAFFTYVAGGFASTVDAKIKSIHGTSGVPGSAMPVANLIRMIESHEESPYSPDQIRNIFSCDRIVTLDDL